MPSNLTVFEAIQRLFPGEASNGDAPYYTWPRIRSIPREYDGSSALPKEVRKKYAMAPLLPFDVFAVCAYLLELSGAYHHVAPVSVDHSPKVNSEIKRLLHVSPERIRGLRDIAVTWRKELEYNKGFLKSVQSKLANERFVSNAKPEILENEKKKLTDAEAKIRSIEEQLNGLK